MTVDALPVSVIIPAYNAGQFLAEAIDSVLAQTRSPAEVIIVDDGSTDDSADTVSAYGSAVHYEYQPNAGVGAARNRGVALARSDLLAFLDADDLWAPDKLVLQTAALDADPTLEAAFAHMRQLMDEGATGANLRVARQQVAGVTASTAVIRRSVFLRIGWFNPVMRSGFLDWFARAVETGMRYVVLPEVLAYRRVHGANMSVRHRAHVQAEYFHILKSALDRRRAGRAEDTCSLP